MNEFSYVILISDREPALGYKTLLEFFSSFQICFHSNYTPHHTRKVLSVKYRPESIGRIESRIVSLNKKL